MEDQFLIEQVLKGNKNAYKMLVIRYQRPLISFFKKFGFTREKNEELTQDVFLKSYQFLKKFDSTKGSFSSWLFSIAKNHALNELKRKTETLLETIEIETVFSMENLIELKDSKEKIHRLLPRIPNPFKIPVILSYIEELTLEEIAMIENCSIGTIKSRIFRGKGILKDMLLNEELI